MAGRAGSCPHCCWRSWWPAGWAAWCSSPATAAGLPPCKAPPAALPPEDQQCIDQFRAVVGPLKVQVQELRQHWETDRKEHAERFQQARTKSQSALEALVRR